MERVTPKSHVCNCLFRKKHFPLVTGEKNQLSQQTFKIYPKAPFDFELNCKVFGFDKPMPEVFENKIWRRAISLTSGKLVPVELRSLGTVDKPEIEVKHYLPITEQEKTELTHVLDEIFSFSQDLTSLYTFMDKDLVLKNLKNRFYGLKAGSIGTTVFEHIVKSIIQQQISIRVAFSITNKMITRFSEQTKSGETVFYDFPTPKKFAETSLEDIRNCGVSWKKAEYIKTVAEKTVDGGFDPESLRLLTNERVAEMLTKFRGIGTWTAEMVLSAGLKRSASIPAGDLGVRRTFSSFYSDGEILSEAQVRKIAASWGEHTKDIVYYISCIERV